MTAIDPSKDIPATRRSSGPGAAMDVPGNGVTGGHSLSIVTTLYLLMIMTPLVFAVGGIALSPVRVILLILIIPLMINLISGQYGRLRIPDIMLFSYVLWQGVSISYWHGTQAIQFVGSTGIEAIGGYLVARATIRSVADFEALARVYGLFALVTVPFAAYEAFTGHRLILEIFDKIPGTNAYNSSTGEQRLGFYRGQVNFTHTIHYGIFVAMAFSMSFLVVKPYVSPTWGWIRSVAIGFGAFFSLSSGGFLVFVLQAGLIGWRWLARGIQAPWKVFIGLFASFYLIIEVLSDRTAFMVLLTMAAFSSHNAYWRTILFDYAMQNVADSPLVGVGLNDWDRPAWIKHPSLDNFWAYIMLVYGVPAFIFLSLSVLLPVIKAMRMKIPESNQRLMRCRAAWVLTMTALIFALCTVHVWGKIYSLVFFIFGTGVWFYDADEELKAEAAGDGSAAPAAKTGPRGSAGRSDRGGRAVPPEGDAVGSAMQDAAAAPTVRYSRFPAKETRHDRTASPGRAKNQR